MKAIMISINPQFVEKILSGEKTYQQSGISEYFFFKYFEKKEIAKAIKISNIQKYENPKSLSDYG